MIPTGRHVEEEAEAEPIGARTFDDLHEVSHDRTLAIEGSGHRLRVFLETGSGPPRRG